MRTRMRIIRNPAHPRTSVISGRASVPEKGVELIDIGAEPINKYGVVLITTDEAKKIAAVVGYVDGVVVTKKFDAMEAELRTLRAYVNALPSASSDFSERFHNGLNDLIGNLTAQYRADLGSVDIPDGAPRPEWASAEREASHIDGSGRAGNLKIIDGGPLDDSGETVGRPPIADSSTDGSDEGKSVKSDESGHGSDRLSTGSSRADDDASHPVGGYDGEGYSASSPLLSIYAGNDE